MSQFRPKHNVVIQSKKKENILKPTQEDFTSNIKHAKDPTRFLKSFEHAIEDYIKKTKDDPNSLKKQKATYWLQWVEDEDKKKFDLYMPGKIGSISLKMSAEERIVYLEQNPSQQMLDELKIKGGQFVDHDFPANSSSLYGPYPQMKIWQNIGWQGISQKIPNAQIFKAKIQPKDIKQGLLGDCYFLAGIAALAEVPQRIRELFLLRQKNQQKYYSVKLLYRGKWRIVNLDQMIPFVAGQKPAFSDSVNSQLWVILLEKAWAKLYKSYKQIQAGFPEEVLHDLTGAPVIRIFLQKKDLDKNRLWQYLMFASKQAFAMVACSNVGSDTQTSPAGIVQGHAYTLLQATQIKLGRNIQRVVQLRNPWGDVQFNGRWSDQDSTWNYIQKQTIQKLGIYRDKSDGIFFMPFDQFLYEFRDIYSAEINDKASYVYEYYNDPKSKGVYFTIIIVHEGLYCFQIDNTPERSFTGKQQQMYRYPQSYLQLKKIDSNVAQDLGATTSKKRTLCKRQFLKPGRYVAFAKVDFDPNFQKSYNVTLAVYGQFCCGIYISTNQDAKKFTGNPKQTWVGQFQKYLFKPILQAKLQNPDKDLFDYSKMNLNNNKKKEEEKKKQNKQQEQRGKQEERKKRMQDLKKKRMTQSQILELEQKRRLEDLKQLEQQKKRLKKQKQKKHSEMSSHKQSRKQQNNMDNNFNDHFSFHEPERKKDPNIKVKPKKKVVVKETIRKTIGQVQSVTGGQIKKQQVTKEQKITTNHYGSRPDMKKKTIIDRNEKEVRQSLMKGDDELIYRYERNLNEKEQQIQNEKGQIKRKLQTDQRITQARADDEDSGIDGFLEWQEMKKQGQREQSIIHQFDNANTDKQTPKKEKRSQNLNKQDEGLKSESSKSFVDGFLQKQRSKNSGTDDKNIQVLKQIAEKVFNDDDFRKRNIIRYHESDESDDVPSFGYHRR